MPSGNYSSGSQFIYKAYLSNYLVAKTSFEFEQFVFRKKIKGTHLNEIVFVTGLARSGTTAVFNALYSTDSFASLTYADMPFLLMPQLGQSFFKTVPSEFVERAHGDGILINNKSPEAFDEYFWKVFLADKYIQDDRLAVHTVGTATIDDYKKYMQLIAYKSHKNAYLSKNNNNILRITSLLHGFPAAKFIVLYREPLAHARSLLNQHIHFSSLQRQDPFIIDYFNYLGHHEFGLNYKPFYLNEDDRPGGDLLELNYWLKNWKNYYRYLLANFNERFCLISFEDLCESPAKIAGYLNKMINLEPPVSITSRHSPKSLSAVSFDQNIYADCMKIYAELNAKRAYNEEADLF